MINWTTALQILDKMYNQAPLSPFAPGFIPIAKPNPLMNALRSDSENEKHHIYRPIPQRGFLTESLSKKDVCI
jgi:hypothetical protein